MAKFIVGFVDAGNCEICQFEVECYRITNASKIALKVMSEEQEAQVQKECVAMRVEQK